MSKPSIVSDGSAHGPSLAVGRDRPSLHLARPLGARHTSFTHLVLNSTPDPASTH